MKRRPLYATRYILTLAGLLAIVLPGGMAAAAGGSVLTTTPISVPLTASPGTSVSRVLQVQNNGTTPISINLKLERFKAQGDTGQAQILPLPPGDTSASWVHFSRTSFTAQPGVWNQVKMTIDLPSTAAFDYYFAVLFVPSSPTDKPTGTTNTFKGANAVLVLLNAHTPGEKRTLGVQSFQADRHIYQYLPATFKVTVHNSGNVYAAPAGDVFISRTRTGPALAALEINHGQGNVLPGSNRIFQVTWDDGFPVYQYKRVNGQIVSDKSGKPEQELRWDISRITKLRIGHYYARLTMVYNDGQRDVPVTSTVGFWVIPWLLLGILLVIALLVLLGLWSLARPLIRRLRGRGRKKTA